MATTTRVIGSDVKPPQADLGPIGTRTIHSMRLLCTLDVTKEHDDAESGEPIAAELGQWDGISHGIGVALLNLFVELIREILHQRPRYIVCRREGYQGGHGDSIPQGYLSRCQHRQTLRLRAGSPRLSVGAMDLGHDGSKTRPR